MALAATLSSLAPWPTHTFISQSPTFYVPEVQYNKTNTTAPGYIFFTSDLAKTGYITTETGDLIWRAPQKQYDFSTFTAQKLWEKDVLAYYDMQYQDYSLIVTYGTVAILDDTYTLKYNVTLKDPELVDQAPGNWASVIDRHEILITQNNTLLVVAHNCTPADLSAVGGPRDGWLRDSLFYELDIKTNEILYRWKASDAVPFTESVAPLKGTYGNGTSREQSWDAYHINSVQDYEDGYLMSVRNTNAVWYMKKATGKLEWTLRGSDGGDFTIDSPNLFSGQHHARIKKGSATDSPTLTLLDNTNLEPVERNASKGLMLQMDFDSMTASTRHVYQDKRDPVYMWHSGSLDRHDASERVFLNYGSWASMQEFTTNGIPVYRMKWSNAPDFDFTYRAFRTEWKGYPLDKPSMKACRRKDAVWIYMSWNGATEVTKWNVYAGKTSDCLEYSATVNKTGFETNTAVGQGVMFVQVEAVGGRDKHSKKRSDVFKVEQC